MSRQFACSLGGVRASMIKLMSNSITGQAMAFQTL
jgi:hypothetical protein